jgi:hypothetical protein
MADKIGVFVVTSRRNYAFAAPLSVIGWRRIGYRCVAVIYPDGQDQFCRDLTAMLMSVGAEVAQAAPAMVELTSKMCYPRPWLGVRLLTLRNISQADPSAFIALGDSDLIRFAPLDPPAGSEGKLVCWNSNMYYGSPWFPRWPSCHIGGDWAAWGQLPGLTPEYAAGGRSQANLWSDEEAMRTYFIAHPEVRRVDLERDLSGPDKHLRMDRDLWLKDQRPLSEMIDAHLPLDCHMSGTWNLRHREKFRAWLTPDEFARIETWRKYCCGE